MKILAPIVDYHLFSFKMGMPERWSHIDNGPWRKFLCLFQIHKGLQLRQRKSKKSRISRTKKQRLISIVSSTCPKRNKDQLLLFHPGHGLCTQIPKRVSIHIRKTRLVGGTLISNTHTVRVPATHIVLHIIYNRSIAAAGHFSLLDRPSIDLIGHLDLIAFLTIKNQIIQMLFTFRHNHPWTVLQHLKKFPGKRQPFLPYLHTKSPHLL